MSNILLSPLRAIRQNCLDCSCGSSNEVEKCVIHDCPLFPYRFGKRPETARKKGKEIGNFERKKAEQGNIPSGLRKFFDATQGTKQIKRKSIVEENNGEQNDHI